MRITKGTNYISFPMVPGGHKAVKALGTSAGVGAAAGAAGASSAIATVVIAAAPYVLCAAIGIGIGVLAVKGRQALKRKKDQKKDGA